MADPDYTNEEWRAIPGWEGLYEASSLGRVRSLDRVTGGKAGTTRRVRGRVLKPGLTMHGYQLVVLKRTGSKGQSKSLHTLICKAFHGLAPERHCVAHGDGSRTNNRADNLRWATWSENQGDRLGHGTHCRGQAHGRSIFTNEQAQELKRRWQAGETQRAMAQEVGCDPSTISYICRDKTYRTE